MTPEQIKALEEFAKDVDKAVKETQLSALRAVIMGHATAIAGIAIALPVSDATACFDAAIGMLTESRNAIGDMK